jgi:hypothetical protein
LLNGLIGCADRRNPFNPFRKSVDSHSWPDLKKRELTKGPLCVMIADKSNKYARCKNEFMLSAAVIVVLLISVLLIVKEPSPVGGT